jgi:hypothetical protein
MILISLDHRKRFEAIKKELSLLGSTESNFLQVELLFFEALSISREYGDDPQANPLLAALRQLQETAYEKTKLPTHKRSQRESLIRRFVLGLKKVLSAIY